MKRERGLLAPEMAEQRQKTRQVWWGRGLPKGKGCHQLLRAHHSLSPPRTLTQDDPGDNQITLEEITQMVSRACPLSHSLAKSVLPWPPGSQDPIPKTCQRSSVIPSIDSWSSPNKEPQNGALKTAEF